MKELEEVATLPAALTVRERSSVLLAPVMDVQTALSRLQQFQEFCAHYLQESKDGGNDGGDYGVIPGTKKKTLFKSGADKLCEVYGLYDEYVITSSVEDWERGLFDYSLKCLLKSRRDDSMVGTGVGSCSTFESKYRWRDSQRLCPSCGQPAIIKGKDFRGDGLPTGWLCFGKKGGCGAKFKDGDKSIEGQIMGRVDNPDIIDLKNTALKMAKKRAKIDATIGVTRSSGTFAQDLDEIPLTATVKPAPAVTDKDIDISAAGKGTVAATEPNPPVQAAAPSPDSVERIGIGQQKNIHIEFRKACAGDAHDKADDHFYQWLTDHGFVNREGAATSAMIPVAKWTETKAAMLAFAKGL